MNFVLVTKINTASLFIKNEQISAAAKSMFAGLSKAMGKDIDLGKMPERESYYLNMDKVIAFSKPAPYDFSDENSEIVIKVAVAGEKNEWILAADDQTLTSIGLK